MGRRANKAAQAEAAAQAQTEAPVAPVAQPEAQAAPVNPGQTPEAKAAVREQAEAAVKALAEVLTDWTDTPDGRAALKAAAHKVRSLKAHLTTAPEVPVTYPGTQDFIFKADAPKDPAKATAQAKVSDEVKAQMVNLLSRVKYLAYMDSQMPGSSWTVQSGPVSIAHGPEGTTLTAHGTTTDISTTAPEALKGLVKAAYLAPAPKAA